MNLFSLSLEAGKILVVYLVVFQMVTQPIAAVAQAQPMLEVPRTLGRGKSNIQDKTADGFDYENFLPNVEKKARQGFSDAFGVNVPLPQMFGENGKLEAMFAGAGASADKNKELIEAALSSGKSAGSNVRKSAQSPSETAISLNAPILNGGLIDGSLRVVRETPFAVADDFRISENLYAAGSPDIQTQNDSHIREVVNDFGDDLAGDYRIHLNGGEIGGKVYIHSAAENLFADIPSGLPAANGTENLEINSAADLKNIKDWSKVRSVFINAAGLTIAIPAGNYESIVFNAPGRLVFEAGDYNFTDTIHFQKGSVLEIKGKTNVGIGKNLIAEDALIRTGGSAAPADVKINVLGSTVILSGQSLVAAQLRAAGGSLIVNENSVVVGRAFARQLVMNGGRILQSYGNEDFSGGAPLAAQTQKVSPVVECTIWGADANSFTAWFGYNNPNAVNVTLPVGAENKFTPNPQNRGQNTTFLPGRKTNTFAVTHPSGNLVWTLNARTATAARNHPTRCQLVSIAYTSPAHGFTTTNPTVNLTGTASSNGPNPVGVASVTVNDVAAVYNAAAKIWSLNDFALAVGANVLTAKVTDNAGNQTTAQITVTREQPVVDSAPPVVAITSPANDSSVQAQTITVSGTAADPGTNASGLASVTVGGQNATVLANGSWTISGVSLNPGANTITARATDNAGNFSTAAVSVTRTEPDTTAPSLAIVSPANNSETSDATVSVSGTATDTGANASGVASVTVGGQPATLSGSGWTIENVALTVGANVITANAIDNAGNSISQQITVTRIEPDTTAPTIVVTAPADNSETNDARITVSGTATDTGANASGVANVTVGGQNANFSNGNWTLTNFALNIGTNTITVRATDNAGNQAASTVTITRREPDSTAPTVTITSPPNNFTTTGETISVAGTVFDGGANASGVQSVVVGGVNATITGSTWNAVNVPLTIGENMITAVARDNNNNTASAAVTVVRNPLDVTAPTITITSPVNNFETFDPQIIVSGTVEDAGAGATGVQSVNVNGVPATYSVGANTWTATVNLTDGANPINVTAIDNAPTPNQGQASISVVKSAILPPTLAITNPQNGAFLSTNSVTVAGSVASNKPDMTFNVSVGGAAANLAGREYTKTHNLNDGTNIITVIATDALGQQAQQSITVTNDRTPPTVFLTNVPAIVNPGESYVIGATAMDAYGIADVEFTVGGASITRTSVSPYQFTLNIPLDQAPNQNLNISAIASDNAGLSATATARIVTSGPSGLTGYVFDDATGYVLRDASARLNNQNPVPTDENGLYSFISTNAAGVISITKEGYTSIARNYSATAGAGVEVFDARLTPLDTKVNTADANGAVTASDLANKIQIGFAPGSFPAGTDVRITSVSPQGLANLLPFGWSPIPDAVVDVRAAADVQFSNRNFANPATLTIPQIAGLSSALPVVLVRYDGAAHVWKVIQKDLFAGTNGMLQASLPVSGQYAFLIADAGATAPPSAVVGANLTASAPANSEQLDGATATANASPSVALYSNTAKSRISFVADSAAKLPSGVAIEASFADSYLTLIDRTFIAIDRPSQDFVLYSFPAVGADEPNKLGAYFVAKPVRTDFGVTDLLNAKVRVEIRSGRMSQTGILIGQSGGVVRGAEGSELEIPNGSVNNSQVVFFNKIPNNQAGVILPEGYELIGAFDVNLAGSTLAQTAKISMPALSGDNSKIVVAKVISIAGQQSLKVVGRVAENNSRLESSIAQPLVPANVNLVGIRDGGKYVFVKMPGDFGYVKGTASSAVVNTQGVKITNTQTPFADLTTNNGSYTILGLANSEPIQVDAISLNNDATGFAATTISAQDAVAVLPISLSSATLSVSAVTPTSAAANVIVTTPVTVTFNKPISTSTVTGSSVKLVTSSGNPVITTLTVLAGGRSVILTPSSNLQSGTDYKIQVSTAVRDIYGNALGNAFESTFRTANAVTAANQLKPAQIKIAYPNEQGFVTISIPAGSVPSGSLIFAINNSSGATVSTVAGSGAIELVLQARVGDEIELIIRQPDGSEYRVKQAAYRRADGFVSVGANGGTITSEDGNLILQVPAGAISGQADVKMSFAPESSIAIPRTGEMAPGEMNYIGGVKIEAQGTFTNTEELHLELPAPTNLPEGQRALIMKPTKINVNGTEIDSWETITSAKVENGKIKTTSPPFVGITLASVIVGLTIALSFFAFMPRRQRVVTGLVRKQKTDGTYEIVRSGDCYILGENGQRTELSAPIQPDGQFTVGHNTLYVPANGNVPVECSSSNAVKSAVAFPYDGTEPGMFGFEKRYANVIYPATSIVNQPPQMLIKGSTLDVNGYPVPEENDLLKRYGKVQAGSNVGIDVLILPSNASLTAQQLIVNGSSQNIEFNCAAAATEAQKNCSALIPTQLPGRYGIVVKARTILSDPLTETTKTFNFNVLSNPNVRPPIRGVNPAVVSISPEDGASQVDVGTSFHIEFSEPVKNLQSGSGLSETVYLLEDGAGGGRVAGRIFSGGLPITPTDAVSVIDFAPNRRLKSGKNYRLIITTDVIDTNGGDAAAVPPIPADPDNLRKLDQNATEGGLQEFSSRFSTFQGTVITPNPINAQGYRILVLDDYVITTKPNFNGLGSTGELLIYDSTEFLGSTDAQNIQPTAGLFLPHVPLGLAAKKQTLTIGGQSRETDLIAVTTLSMDTYRPRNVWFYHIAENEQLRLLGVVSLHANGLGNQSPNSISIEGKRAYIGSSSNGGVYVVDIQQAIDAFSAADDTPNDGNEYNNNPVRGAISAPGQPYAGGFGQSALMQRATYLSGNDLFPVNNVSTITQGLVPHTFTTSSNPKLISFGFPVQLDGRVGSLPGAGGMDARVAANLTPTPTGNFSDIEAASGLQIQGVTKDIAVGIAGHLFIFDVTTSRNPTQYPTPPDGQPQQPAKTFTELGVPSEFGTYGKQVEIEETLVYVMFDNGVAVFDISNPNDPYLTTLIRGLTGLRYMAVKDGFIYTLGNNGLNVSIGRAVAQVITYGYDPSAPDDVCGNPVIISKDERKMMRPAGIFFQLFGQSSPRNAQVVIRRVDASGGTATEIATVSVNPENLRTVSNPQTGTYIVSGYTFWEDNDVTIEPEARYTAEVVVNNDFRSRQVDIPFSHLLPDSSFLKTVVVKEVATSADPQNSSNTEEIGSLNYVLAGNAVEVEFGINGESAPLYDSRRSNRQRKSGTRSFGVNTDFLLPRNLGDGLWEFTYSAKLKANRAYSEQITGTVRIGSVSDDVRKPGSTVVGGIEINSGNLALSENDIAVKGRGLSLDLTRSYNSQAAERFGTLGYGWTHSYQVSLIRTPDGYQMTGGEGNKQTFKDGNLQNGEIKADAPYLGRLVKRADGSIDYFTKSQTKYHFRLPFEPDNPNIYLGNLEHIEDPNGNRIRLNYDTSGRVSSVADGSGRRLNFEYEGAEDVFTGISAGDVIQGLQGCPKASQFKRNSRRLDQYLTGKAWRVKTVTGVNLGGLTIDYLYDEKGNLSSVTRSGLDLISTSTASREWKYTYNPSQNGDEKYSHLLKTVKSPNNADNAFTEYKYFLAAAAPPQIQQILMPEGVVNSFTYDYDQANDIVNSATFTDGEGNRTIYQLEEGRVETITAPLGAVTRLEWTDFGQIKKTTDPEGKITEIVFDANNNPSTQTLSGGGETIETVTIFDAKFSKMASFTDGNGNTTSYAVNQTTGNVDQITLPTGRTVEFRYFPNGDLKEVTDQYGTKTEFLNYDAYGNPQRITKQLSGGQTQIITQTFDARSRQRSKSDNLGTNATFNYDALDRPTEQITEDPAGYRNTLTVETTYLPEGQPNRIVQKDGDSEINRTVNTYDKLQRLTRTVETVSGYAQPFTRNFTYDFNSNLKTEQNRRGIATEKFYDALNHLTKIIQGGKTIWEATEIDKVGNPKAVTDLYGNSTVYVYDGLQRLKEKQLPESVTEKLEYDDNNNITASFDRNNRKTGYAYDALNRVDTVTDALGRITKWTYTDAAHTVKKETVHRGLTETTVLDGLERPLLQTIRAAGGINYQTSYAYSGRNVTVTDARGTITTQKMSGFGETGEVLVEGIDAQGTNYKVETRYGALGGVSRIIDPLNRVTTVATDGFNRHRNISYNGEYAESFVYDGEGLLTEHTNRRGVVSAMSYDELGRTDTTVVRETIPAARSITVRDYNYLDAENREEVTDANAHTTTVQYDGLRRVRQLTNADGKVKSYIYDGENPAVSERKNSIKKVKSYIYDGENLRSETDYYNRPTAYEYDALNRVTKVFDRDNKLTLINYAANDLVKRTTDRRGNTFTEEYDALGRATSSMDTLGNKIASYTYDGVNNHLTQKDGENNETAFAYDKLNRLTAITHPNGLQTETITYDAAGNVKTHADGRGGTVESLEYDALDQLKKAKDGAGNISEFQYDGGGLLLSKKDPKLNVTSYAYNAFGSLVSVAEPGLPAWTLSYDDAQNLTSVKDSRNYTTAYEYDALNRLKKTTQPLGRTTNYTYDDNSNVSSVTDPKGQTAQMTYTVRDDVATAIYKNSSNSTQLTLDYSYDAEQNLWRVDENKAGIAGTRTYTREYDERNRLTKNTDSTNKIVKFGYDAANNLKTLTDASNRITTYNYDAKNQLDTVVQNTATVADYDWFADGLLQKVSYQNGTSRNYLYDTADRVTNITNNLGAGQSESYDYGYDANSNRQSEVRKENGVARRTAAYNYDGLDRLKNVDYVFNVQTPNPPLGQTAVYVENSEQNAYGYDAVGNRINETNRTQSKTITLITDANGTSRNEQVSQSPEQTTTATFNDLNELTQLN